MNPQLISLLKPLYKKESERIVLELEKYAKTIQKIELQKPDLNWYKFIDMYSTYPDGLRLNRQKKPFENLEDHIDIIQKLGCNALHILPFLKSPMIDKGFDISDFYQPRSELGTLKQLQSVVKKASDNGVWVFMDLVFNHVSEEHDWFKKAQSGDEKYRNYFLFTKEKPKYIRSFEKDSAVWAEFEVEQKKIAVNIAFPDRPGEIPLFRQGSDGYWYYHTYYPEEIDLNWFNPDVFIEMAKIMMFWCSQGFNFRLDAIPFIGKKMYKNPSVANDFTHKIVAALRNIATSINPECVLLVETYEKLDSIIQYFGTTNEAEANLAYNFFLTTATWVSMATEDNSHIWKNLGKMSITPKHAEWINFLRNHDELSLAYLAEKDLQVVHQKLSSLGQPFRSKFGISGRTYSLLKHNQKKFFMAYFLLMSLPGGVMIQYGDEIGKGNIPLDKLPTKLQQDTRNINRGVITRKEYFSKKSQTFFKFMSYFFHKRREFRDYLNVWPKKISTAKEIIAASYQLGISELRFYVNLSSLSKKISAKTADFQILATVNNAKMTNGKIELGPYGGIWIQK